MEGAGPAYAGALSACTVVDAVQSRQMSAAAGVARAHLAGAAPGRVVIHLGSNGDVDGGDVEALLGVLRAVPVVVLVTVQLNHTRPWQDEVNAQLSAAAGRWPNVRVADWRAASEGHSTWFAGDGIHLNSDGAAAYASVIAASL